MALLLVSNDKGGVGKSMIAPELAVYLYDHGNSVALVDADRQLHAAKHIRTAEPNISVGALQDKTEIKATIPKALERHAYVVADAPANLGDETRTLMTLADVVIIPTVDSIDDFESTVATYQLIERCREATGGNPEIVHVVFNKIDGRAIDNYEDYRAQAVAEGLPVTNAFIKLRRTFQYAKKRGTTVGRLKTPSAREAKGELTAVFAEIFQSMLKKKVANE